MADDAARGGRPVLTPALIRQIEEKVAQAMGLRYATIELVIEGGKLRWIRGPAPSEPARTD